MSDVRYRRPESGAEGCSSGQSLLVRRLLYTQGWRKHGFHGSRTGSLGVDNVHLETKCPALALQTEVHGQTLCHVDDALRHLQKSQSIRSYQAICHQGLMQLEQHLESMPLVRSSREWWSSWSITQLSSKGLKCSVYTQMTQESQSSLL